MDRPGYPIIINLISKIIHLFVEQFYKISMLQITAISYISFKFFLFLYSGLLYLKYSKKYFDTQVCLLAVLLFFSQKYSIVNATTFHTTELSILTPILIFVMFINLVEKYSLKKNFIYSFIVGVLMLCKPNYAAYLTLIIFCIYKKSYTQAIFNFAFHTLPFLIYLIYLNMINMDFYSFSSNEYGHLTHIFDKFKQNPFDVILFQIPHFFYKFILGLWDTFHFWLVTTIFGLYILKKNKKIKNDHFIILIIFFVMLFAQFFGSNATGIVLPDISFLVFLISSYLIIKLFGKIKITKYVVTLSVVITLLSIAKFPWIHPYDQEKHNFKKKQYDLINKYEIK